MNPTATGITIDNANVKQKASIYDKNVLGVRFSTLLFIALAGAFIGYLSENIQRIIVYGIFDDRHQLLPFLGAYGVGIFVLYLVFGVPTKMRLFKKQLFLGYDAVNKILSVITYFVVVFALVLVGEMGVGLMFEHVFGIKNAWDLSQFPLAITQYTSVVTSLAYSAVITVLMGVIFPLGVKLFNKIPKKPALVISAALSALVLIDFFIMIFTAAFTGSLPNYWSIQLFIK